ncbi:MAG: ZIP family metal transporter [Euryarchaeota archaeon]|jgi:zinc and cadmium transporter|nr:ZIP family metal transporter [Euryarchaeota archaeon]MDP6575751.1 ZIP family metal transporter [Candidatus Peribacteraceae bacterium]HCI04329.1 ZIP family metal transporter [Candidatus Peribacteria bacterium]|tara:strand:+ start:1193 stop:1999 length:807 start_codon:yes stop_codon:yes gene_type:complete
MNLYAYIFGSILLVSLISLAGILLLSISKQATNKILLYLVSFSTGALLSTVFLHFFPEIIEIEPHPIRASWLLLGSILFSFVMERFIHWRHCHAVDDECHIHPVGPMMLMADIIHNILDGVLIAASYLISIPLGIATTLAVMFHEIPQEIGDFAVLLHSGYSKKKALLLNLLTALTAFIGALLVLWINVTIDGIAIILLPIAAGNFLYIATADLIPELHKETKFKKSFLQFIFLLLGVGVMTLLALAEPGHGSVQEETPEAVPEVPLT